MTLIWWHWYDDTDMMTLIWWHWYDDTDMMTLIWWHWWYFHAEWNTSVAGASQIWQRLKLVNAQFVLKCTVQAVWNDDLQSCLCVYSFVNPFLHNQFQDRKCTYNITFRSFRSNQCCNGAAISIIYSECAFEALGTQPAMRMCHIAICGLSDSKRFFHII
jgi:hypothetical protein